MMEASLVNILAPGRAHAGLRAWIQFGERFADIARALGANVDTIDIPWGRAIDPADIDKRVGRHRLSRRGHGT